MVTVLGWVCGMWQDYCNLIGRFDHNTIFVPLDKYYYSNNIQSTILPIKHVDKSLATFNVAKEQALKQALLTLAKNIAKDISEALEKSNDIPKTYIYTKEKIEYTIL